MRMQVNELIGAHNPLPIEFDFGNDFNDSLIGQSIELSVNFMREQKFFSTQYVIHSKKMFIDISGFLKSIFNNKEPENLANSLIYQVKKNSVGFVICFNESCPLDANAMSYYVNGIINIENVSELSFFRLAPNGEQVNITYFKGYPQVDIYLSKFKAHNDRRAEIYSVYKERNAQSSIYSDLIEAKPSEFVQREVDECGIFLRWRNTYGGWSYWLFDDEYTEEQKTKSLGSMSLFSKNIPERSHQLYHFGFTAKKTWKLNSKIPVLENEIEEIKTLFISPEVYIFTGNRNDEIMTQLDSENWERVAIVEGTQKFDMNAHATYNVGVTIEFNDLPTIKQI